MPKKSGHSRLTEKQKRFADEYLIDLNATRAYKEVYTAVKKDETAAVNASKLLRNTKVAEYIKERIEKRAERTEVTQDKVINELAKVAFANGADFAKVVEKTFKEPVFDKETGAFITEEEAERKVVDIELTENLPEDKKAAISCIKNTKFGISVETYDKVKALELLGRHLGMWNDKQEITANISYEDYIKNLPEETRL